MLNSNFQLSKGLLLIQEVTRELHPVTKRECFYAIGQFVPKGAREPQNVKVQISSFFNPQSYWKDKQFKHPTQLNTYAVNIYEVNHFTVQKEGLPAYTASNVNWEIDLECTKKFKEIVLKEETEVIDEYCYEYHETVFEDDKGNVIVD